MSELTGKDRARYAFLFLLFTLVVTSVLGPREGGAVLLLGLYLVLGAAAAVAITWRRSRS